MTYHAMHPSQAWEAKADPATDPRTRYNTLGRECGGRASHGRIVRRIYSFNSSFDIRRGSLNETNILNLVNSGVFHHHLGA